MKRKNPKKRGLKKKEVEKLTLVPANRVFSEERNGKGLVVGKSINDLRQKYIVVGGEDASKKRSKSFNPSKSGNVKAMVIKKKTTGNFSDLSIQERTVLVSNGKIIAEQG